jgi:hypothetical protein
MALQPLQVQPTNVQFVPSTMRGNPDGSNTPIPASWQITLQVSVPLADLPDAPVHTWTVAPSAPSAP